VVYRWGVLGLEGRVVRLVQAFWARRPTEVATVVPDDGRGWEVASLAGYAVQRVWRFVAGLTLTCVVLWVAALPLVAFHFERVALLGAVGSMVLTLPVTAVILLSFLKMLGGLVFPPAGAVMGELLNVVTRWILDLAALFPEDGVVAVARPPTFWVVLVYMALLLGAVGARREPTVEGVL